MKIALIDADSHNFPNLALMKLSAYHKAKGNQVEWWIGFSHYDILYLSKVFTNEYSPDILEPVNAERIIKGGTGYSLNNKLPDEIEHIYPDYSLYPALTKDTAYGFLTRGCSRQCPFCVVAEKEGVRSRKVADLSKWWSGQKNIKLLDPNILACSESLELLQQLADSGAWVDFTQGLDARLITKEYCTALNKVKTKEIHFAWDNMREEKTILRGLTLYAENAVRKPHGYYGSVYVLVNFNTTMQENLYRIDTLRKMNFDPYVMIYDKPNAPPDIRALQRWCNNKRIFRTVSRFEDYAGGMRKWT